MNRRERPRSHDPLAVRTREARPRRPLAPLARVAVVFGAILAGANLFVAVALAAVAGAVPAHAAAASATEPVLAVTPAPADTVPARVKKDLKAGKSEVRLEAVREAAKAGPAAVPLLVPVAAGDKEGRVRDAAFQELIRIDGAAEELAEAARGRDPAARAVASEALGAMRAEGDDVAAALARGLADPDLDVRRAAAYAAGVCKASSCADALASVIDGEDDVAAALALESLSRLRPPGVVDALVARSASARPAVRAAALRQLRYHDRDVAAEQIGAALSDPALRGEDAPAGPVLAAAIAEAAEARRAEHVGPLVELLRHPRERVADAAWRTLRGITRVEMGPDPGGWEEWFAHYGEGFRVPKEDGGSPGVASTASRATFLGAPVISDRVVFVIDYSGSMRDDGVDGRPKIDAAREAMTAVLEALGESARFSVVAFSDAPRVLSETLIAADAKGVQAATRFLKAAAPKGYTNVYDGLAAALAIADVDTVVLLSDGAPSAGTFEQYSRIRYHVQRLNRRRGAAITTVALTADEKPRRFLEQLAEDSGGRAITP